MKELPKIGDTVHNTQLDEDAEVVYLDPKIIVLQAEKMDEELQYTHEQFRANDVLEW